jgi:hypothetical protein
MSDDPKQEPAEPVAADEQGEPVPQGAADEEGEPVGGFEAYQDPGEEPVHAYSTAEFHNVIQKHIVGATYDMMVESKFPWELVEPFLRASRDMFRGDFERTGRLGIHGVTADGDSWIDAEEAYVSLSVADQDDGREWLSETWWLSDLVLAEAEPQRVREAARALNRTVAKLDAWLAANDPEKTKGPDDA